MARDEVFPGVSLVAVLAGKGSLTGVDALMARTVLAPLEDPGAGATLVDPSLLAGHFRVNGTALFLDRGTGSQRQTRHSSFCAGMSVRQRQVGRAN